MHSQKRRVLQCAPVCLTVVIACSSDPAVAPDTEAPVVTLTEPPAGSVNGVVILTATAHDNRRVRAVRFLVGGTVVGSEDADPPYSVEWNTSSLAEGSYTLSATAWDEAGNAGSSLPLSVILRRQSPAFGGLRVSTATSGAGTDPNGYEVAVDGVLRGVVSVNGSVTLPNLPPGERSLRLRDLAANCTVLGTHPRLVTVVAETVVDVAFEVTCIATPPPEARIAFASALAGGGNLDIYTITASGTGLTRLTSGIGSKIGPAWSPDRSKLAFSSDAGGGLNHDIWLMNSDGSFPVNVTQRVGDNRYPAWSPDGSRIAFESNRDGGADIYVMDADGSNVVRLTATFGIAESWPSWSPDGSRIVFVADYNLYVMNADGTGTVQITSDPSVEYAPAWSPAGDRIAFTSPRSAVYDDIWLINPDGSGLLQLTTEYGTDRDPTWSPDGNRIAFSSVRDGMEDIFVINADGTGAVNVTNSPDFPAQDMQPAWAP